MKCGMPLIVSGDVIASNTFAGQSSDEGAAEKPHQSACEAAGGANTITTRITGGR
jgi:hypothetical protein